MTFTGASFRFPFRILPPGLGQRCDRDGAMVGPEERDCPPNPFLIIPDSCEYIDQQSFKLQEAPEDVPTGEMPRNILLNVDRHLVDKVSPGTRVSVVGIASLFNGGGKSRLGAVAVRQMYLKVVGIEVQSEGAGRAKDYFTPEEEEKFMAMSRDPDIYEKLVDSIAPSISGDYTKDIKKALACQLFGGSRKRLPDGMRLRGDINVLLLGDPSTAKSQFLKFIEKVAPVGVYTSGKGSSAAGLTASVIRDSRREYYLEGGAMVLADGGICCIDEFDKMREQDRVAIHEAMEQQTISIAKAGITTVLNSRTSVLAAANPIFGRYDDLKTAAENIDLMTTILSRFDLIFIVRDVRDVERDRAIARHVMGIHINASSGAAAQAGVEGEIDLDTMKKYVQYCRSKCSPRLSEETSQLLSRFVLLHSWHSAASLLCVCVCARLPCDHATVTRLTRFIPLLICDDDHRFSCEANMCLSETTCGKEEGRWVRRPRQFPSPSASSRPSFASAKASRSLSCRHRFRFGTCRKPCASSKSPL